MYIFRHGQLSYYLLNREREDLEIPPGTQQARETLDKNTRYQFTDLDHSNYFNSVPDTQNKADG